MTDPIWILAMNDTYCPRHFTWRLHSVVVIWLARNGLVYAMGRESRYTPVKKKICAVEFNSLLHTCTLFILHVQRRNVILDGSTE
jgi:hypothetical protein